MRLVALLVVLASGCDALPRDPDETLERIRTDRSFRVGFVAGAEELGREIALVDAVAARTGARPSFKVGAGELLLGQLEGGQLDLVVGHFDKKSPWNKRVHFAVLDHPIGPLGVHQVAAALPNGENRWIMLVEREAIRIAGSAR